MALPFLPNAFARRIPTLRYLAFHFVDSSSSSSAPHKSKWWSVTRTKVLDTDAPTTHIKELSRVEGEEAEERMLALDKSASLEFDNEHADV